MAGVLVSLGVSRVRVLPKQKRALLELSAFREAPYSMFTIGMFFSFLGLYIPIFYIQTYAIQKGITSQNLGFYLLPILNAASIFGRIIPNFIADKAGALNILVPCCFAASILSFAWIGIDKAPGLIVFAILYGFFSGAFVSLPPTAVVALSPHLGVIGTRMGMCFALASLGLLIGTPVSGAILNRTGDFLGPQALSGAMVLLAGSSILASRIIKHGPKLLLKA